MEKTSWTLRVERVRFRISLVLDKVEVFMLVAGTAILTVILIVNIIARELFTAIYFIEEITQLTVIWTTFGGISFAVRKVRHIRMGALYDAMPRKVRKVLIYFLTGVSAVVMLTLGVLSILYLIKVGRLGQTTPALRIPYWLFIFITPAGFLAAGLQYVLTILKNIAEKDVWLSAEQVGEYEEVQY
jgi:C4-dicarboxylate transporter DctQ subunit